MAGVWGRRRKEVSMEKKKEEKKIIKKRTTTGVTTGYGNKYSGRSGMSLGDERE